MKETNIQKLDFLLDKIVETNYLVTFDDLLKSEFYDINDLDNAEKDFNRFQKFFNDFNVGEISTKEDNSWIRKNINTLDFHEKGGFSIKFIERKISAESERKAESRLIEKENLEKINLELQNENLKYSQSLRKQKEKISQLTSENLKLENKQLRRNVLYSIIAFILGAILTNYKDILIYLNKYF